jgi:hypothetical protein
MKRLIVIFIVAAYLASCGKHSHIDTHLTLNPDLLRIDSLMQHDPDSALQTLLSCHSEYEVRGTSSDINAHYQALLISEALYKTYNKQYYRNELQAAKQYFDSIFMIYPKNDDVATLLARSHYMNGVGFYENDSVVDACKEYLHTLEIMENHFDVEKLRGYKAKFMGLTYNRLKGLFSDQFMIEPAIYCGKKSLYYCKIAQTSKYGISNNLAKLGMLYDMSEQTDSAYYYYNEGLKLLPDTNSLIYRDLVSSLALLSYKLGYGFQPSLKKLLFVADHADNEDELLTRYFTIGGLYYEESIYDSAVKYLYRVFEYEKDYMRKQQAADFLMNIYKTFNDTTKLSKYSIFLAQYTMLKYDESINASALNELFQNYLIKKQTELQKKDRIRTRIAISLFVIMALLSIVFLVTHSSKKIDELNKKHLRTISTEKKARYREKNKMLDTIKRQETKVDALEQELGQKRYEADLRMISLLDDPVCQQIKNSVYSISISSRVNCADYPHLRLTAETITDLDQAVSKHFPNLKQRLYNLYPKLKYNELLMCYLYLLGFNNQQISVLMQYHYTTVFRKEEKLESVFNISVTLSEFLQKTAVL